jgi:hypothetical protein
MCGDGGNYVGEHKWICGGGGVVVSGWDGVGVGAKSGGSVVWDRAWSDI